MEEDNKMPVYFTKEVEDRVRNLNDEEMFKLLFQLEQSEYWVAIMRYIQVRSSYTQSAILAADPVKEPTAIARNQGIMMGLADLQNAVVMLWQEKKKEDQAAEAGTDVE